MTRLALLLAVLAVGPVRAQTAPPVPGALSVESEPANAAVTVDGVLRGRTPAALAVASGERRVRVSLTGYAPFEDTVSVAPGDTARVVARLVRLSGLVSVAGLPPEATATVDGEPLGAARPTPTGLVTVVVSVPGRTPLRAVVPVVNGSETRVTYEPGAFRPSRALLAAMGPGVLQVRDGRPAVGSLYAAAVVGGLATAAVASITADRASRDIGLALDRYDAADNEPDAVAAREDAQRLTDVVRASRRLRGASLVTAGLVYVVSVVDSFAHHVRRPALSSATARTSPVSYHLSGDGAGLALRF